MEPSAHAQDASFAVQLLGHIDGGAFGNSDYLYCRYSFSFGNDWDIIAGLDNGLSQTSCRNNLSPDSNSVVWNFPLDVTFKATNVHGWPRIALSVYGIDYFGRDVVYGYGSALIPLCAGSHQIKIDMFAPIANSQFNEFMSWVMGNPPEFFDSRFVCQGEGREVSRTKTTGTVDITLQVMIKGLERFGFTMSH